MVERAFHGFVNIANEPRPVAISSSSARSTLRLQRKAQTNKNGKYFRMFRPILKPKAGRVFEFCDCIDGSHACYAISIDIFANIAKEITVCSVSLTDSIVDNWEISWEEYIHAISFVSKVSSINWIFDKALEILCLFLLMVSHKNIQLLCSTISRGRICVFDSTNDSTAGWTFTTIKQSSPSFTFTTMDIFANISRQST